MKNKDHVPLYLIGSHYDGITQWLTEDLPFYLDQIRSFGDPVLELASGTGRLAIPIAREGFRITGLDITDTMLEHAREKARQADVSVEWIKADFRDFRLPEKFNVILFPFNSISHLYDAKSIQSCFSRVRDHLTDQGRFIIDFFNPRLDLLMRDPSEQYPANIDYPDPDGRGEIVVSESVRYDAATQINHILWTFDIGGKEKIVEELNMRIFYPQELDALLRANGFVVESKYGDYDRSPFESSSPKQLIISKKQ